MSLSLYPDILDRTYSSPPASSAEILGMSYHVWYDLHCLSTWLKKGVGPERERDRERS